MLKKLGRSGGPEEDRTPDLFIAKDAVTRNINDLRRCSNVENSPKMGGECTTRAQSRWLVMLGWLARICTRKKPAVPPPPDEYWTAREADEEARRGVPYSKSTSDQEGGDRG